MDMTKLMTEMDCASDVLGAMTIIDKPNLDHRALNFF